MYYVVYNPFRRRKPRLEVYKLVNNAYELHDGNPVWLPEIGLGMGQYQVQKFTGNDRIISTTFPELALTVKQVVATSQIQKL